jgi:SAM-dependent methyltransferase
VTERDSLREKYTGSEASEYEAKRSKSEKWNNEQRLVSMLLDDLSSVGVAEVLDSPCGTGRYIPEYARLDLTGVGVDASEDMLQQARDKKEEVGLSSFRLEQRDIFDLSDVEADPDVIVCSRFSNWVDKNDLATILDQFVSKEPQYIIMDVGVTGDGQLQSDEEPLLIRAVNVLKSEGIVEFVRGTFSYAKDQLSSESDSGPRLYAHDEEYLIEMWDDRELSVVESHLIADRELSHGKYGQRNLYLLENEKY